MAEKSKLKLPEPFRSSGVWNSHAYGGDATNADAAVVDGYWLTSVIEVDLVLDHRRGFRGQYRLAHWRHGIQQWATEWTTDTQKLWAYFIAVKLSQNAEINPSEHSS